MSAARAFEETSERYGGQWRTVARVHCRQCGVSESVKLETHSGLLPPVAISKKLEQRGWKLGPNNQWDFCPACSNKKKDEKQQMLKVVSPSPSEEPPKEMTREDRRIIFAKLDEVYLDEKRGYESGWSDHKLASDLGVPRKWVETIREENFGSIGTNPEIQEFLTAAEALLADARKALADAAKARSDIEAILKRPDFLTLSDIADRVSKVEKLAVAVRKQVVVP